MNKKYEFTGEEKQVYGRTLKRIKTNKYRGWEILVGVESIDRNDCLNFSE